MKKLINILVLTFVFMSFFSSCSDEDTSFDGKGKVNLKMYIKEDISQFSRDAESDALAANCTIYIYSEKGLIREYIGANNMPSDLWLVSGEYKASAHAGDSVAASFDKKYYKGSIPFTVKKDAVANATIECKIVNVVSSVKLDPSIDGVLSDYTITIGNSKGSLDFNAQNVATAKGYYMMPKEETDLDWTINGTMANGSPYTQSGKIANVKKATEYALHFAYNPETSDIGGALLTVTVDDTQIDMPDNIEIAGAPKILGIGFDLASPIYSGIGNMNKVSVWVSAVAALSNLEVSCDHFMSLGLPTNSFDFMTMTVAAKDILAAGGISETYTYNDVEQTSADKISFSKDLLNKLVNGSYEISIKATDTNGKSRTAILKIVISNASVVAVDVVRGDIWAKRATIYGNLADVTATNPAFNVRKKGDATWTSVDATVNGATFSSTLTELTPGTTYQFSVKCDDFVSPDINEFTTEGAYTIPNSGFEDWSTASDKAIMPMAAGQDFWDTGNHGTIKMSKNVTTSDASIKHSGNYSLKMASAFAGIGSIGKFAAGNLFSGVFGSVDMGTMAATLTFGRPYTGSRPTKMVGYYKYNPGTVDYGSDKIQKGATDIGQIFIALSDKGSPWNIDSGKNAFFDKDASDIIAYGELIATTVVGADGLVKFEIPLEYRSLTRIPNHIILVASASRYGDYFSGSTSSVMWIDDLELVYE